MDPDPGGGGGVGYIDDDGRGPVAAPSPGPSIKEEDEDDAVDLIVVLVGLIPCCCFGFGTPCKGVGGDETKVPVDGWVVVALPPSGLLTPPPAAAADAEVGVFTLLILVGVVVGLLGAPVPPGLRGAGIWVGKPCCSWHEPSRIGFALQSLLSWSST